MSPTLDIEFDEPEELYLNGYVFLLGANEDGVFLDSFLDVSYAIGKTWIGMQAAEKLTGVKDVEGGAIAVALHGMSLRARFVTGVSDPGPYLVKTAFALTYDDLQNYLRALPPDRRKAFLKAAKI